MIFSFRVNDFKNFQIWEEQGVCQGRQMKELIEMVREFYENVGCGGFLVDELVRKI